jgi:hypothetical protein
MSEKDRASAAVVGLHAMIMAHAVLLRVLVRHACLNNPKFADDARQLFDTFLGKSLMQDQPKDSALENELMVRARTNFMTILDQPMLVPDTRPLTLRRRFLNWLERG